MIEIIKDDKKYKFPDDIINMAEEMEKNNSAIYSRVIAIEQTAHERIDNLRKDATTAFQNQAVEIVALRERIEKIEERIAGIECNQIDYFIGLVERQGGK